MAKLVFLPEILPKDGVKKREVFMIAMFQNRGRVCAITFVLLVSAFFFALPQRAFAHARLVRSSPESGTVVQSVNKIEIWFNELLDGQFNTIEVFPASEINSKTRNLFTEGSAKVDPKDRTHLTVDVKALAPGSYYVEYRVLSLDGHSAPGRFQFQVSKQ